MFFGSLSQPERPVTPTPSFILTDTGSTLEPSLPEVGFTLARTLDKRLGNLKKTVGENYPPNRRKFTHEQKKDLIIKNPKP